MVFFVSLSRQVIKECNYQSGDCIMLKKFFKKFIQRKLSKTCSRRKFLNFVLPGLIH